MDGSSTPHGRLNISGVLPHLAVKAEHLPRRSETGIGALMPWANRLWFVTYVAHKSTSGGGTGLFGIDDEFNLAKHPASVVGTYANRMIHSETSQLIIGPHAIDTEGQVRTFESLVDVRLTATCRHLSDPKNKVYFVGMEGEFFEADVRSLEARQLFDLTKELDTSGPGRAHFKDGYSDHGRVVVANNSYYPEDYGRDESNGRLAEWDGSEWKVLSRTQFNTVAGRSGGKLGRAIYAVGQDKASAILDVYLPNTGWSRYRLPKATHTQDHAWTTEWPRIREVESERWLMNASGMFYELPAMAYADRIRGVRPICTHLRIIADYCSWNGLLVMAGDQTTPISDTNAYVGQPQANLWFGKTDDLWRFGGKPSGWGGPWRDTPVRPGEPSDPYLMTGFEHKGLHLCHDVVGPVEFGVEIDLTGDGDWKPYETFTVGTKGYLHHEFPAGFSAQWVRVTADSPCRATAWLVYT